MVSLFCAAFGLVVVGYVVVLVFGDFGNLVAGVWSFWFGVGLGLFDWCGVWVV